MELKYFLKACMLIFWFSAPIRYCLRFYLLSPSRVSSPVLDLGSLLGSLEIQDPNIGSLLGSLEIQDPNIGSLFGSLEIQDPNIGSLLATIYCTSSSPYPFVDKGPSLKVLVAPWLVSGGPMLVCFHRAVAGMASGCNVMAQFVTRYKLEHKLPICACISCSVIVSSSM